VAKTKPKTFDSLTLAIIRRALNGLATQHDWRKLQRVGAAVQLQSDRRWVVTLPAIDALSTWNRAHRSHLHTEYPANIENVNNGEVQS
jgi:hypothetical protein